MARKKSRAQHAREPRPLPDDLVTVSQASHKPQALDPLQARAEMLAVIREIVEACAAIEEPIRTEAVAQVLLEATQFTGREEAIRTLNEDELHLVYGLSTVTAALRGLTYGLANFMQPSRIRGQLERLPERIHKEVNAALLPLLDALSKEQVLKITLESTRWAYVIWSPSEQRFHLDLLRDVAAGRYISKERKARAQEQFDRYSQSMPIAKEWRKSGDGGDNEGSKGEAGGPVSGR